MSGICGIVRFDCELIKKEDIDKMLDAMKNRGNDTEGIWIDDNVGFGHKLLWTTPESLSENQPLISKDDNLVLTADVRIDNRGELFEKLNIDQKNTDIITDSDLILFSYQKWGEECAKYLRGDFAFIIWDKNYRKLFAARDHIGIKPFYYFMTAFDTNGIKNITMYLKYFSASGLLVKSVYILCNNRKFIKSILKVNQCIMGEIWLCFLNFVLAPAVPIPNKGMITFKSL